MDEGRKKLAAIIVALQKLHDDNDCKIEDLSLELNNEIVTEEDYPARRLINKFTGTSTYVVRLTTHRKPN